MKKLLLSIMCIGILMVSCDDEDTRFHLENENVDENYHAKEFIQESKEALKQTKTINADELPKEIVLNEGTKLWIPKDVFTKNGEPISGDFTLEVYEMLKPSSIIFSGTNTNHISGSILESDGFIHIDVKQNGESIDKDLAGYIQVSIPTAKEGEGTQLWVGNENAGPDEDQFAWDDPEREEFANIENMQDGGAWTWAGKGYFDFGITKLMWANCDILWNSTAEKTTVTVKITGQIGKLASYCAGEGDTYIIFCAKGTNVVAQLYTPVDDTTVMSYENTMPIGSKGKMIAFTVKAGIFSYSEQEITITADMQLTLDLKSVTKEVLEEKIKSLDNYK